MVLVCGGPQPHRRRSHRPGGGRSLRPAAHPVPGLVRHHRSTLCQPGQAHARQQRQAGLAAAGCEILDNPVGTACGFVVTHTGHQGPKPALLHPGVPFEFKQMVREQIMPRLKALAGEQTDTELRRFYTFGVSESALSDMLDGAPWPAGIELGYRSSMPLIELKLIGHGASAADMDAAEARLLAAIEPWLVGRGDESRRGRSWICWG